VRVADVMTQASITESPSDTVRQAAEKMWRQQTGSLVVVDGGDFVGIVTERDILKAVANGVDVDSTQVGDLMTRDMITTSPDTALRDAARLMARHWIRHLPVLKGTEVVGILSQRDVAGIFAALSHEPGEVEIEVDQLVRERRLARIEHGDLD
jgi:predicted transcriptional regulator